MTDDEALDVITNLSAWWSEAWPDTRVEIWRAELVKLNAAATIAAVGRLAGRSKRCPTFAELLAETEPIARHPSTQPTKCGYCDGTGLVECRDDRRHGPDCKRDGDCLCSAVVPCRACPRGRLIDKRMQETG